MPTQTSYTPTLLRALVGQVVNMEAHNVVSRETGGTVSIPFGKPVLQGPTDKSIVPVAGNTSAFVGISCLDPTTFPAAPDMYQVGETASVMTMGVIAVITAVPVTPYQPVYYDANGNWTNIATGNTAVPRATFDRTSDSNNLTDIRIG